MWSLFANPVTYYDDNSSTTPLHNQQGEWVGDSPLLILVVYALRWAQLLSKGQVSIL